MGSPDKSVQLSRKEREFARREDEIYAHLAMAFQWELISKLSVVDQTGSVVTRFRQFTSIASRTT